MFTRVLDEEGEGERGAVREAKDAVEGTLGADDVVKEVVCRLHGFLVVGFEALGPIVVAVIRTLVDVFDAGAGVAADFAADVDEGCAVIFSQVTGEVA